MRCVVYYEPGNLQAAVATAEHGEEHSTRLYTNNGSIYMAVAEAHADVYVQRHGGTPEPVARQADVDRVMAKALTLEDVVETKAADAEVVHTADLNGMLAAMANDAGSALGSVKHNNII